MCGIALQFGNNVNKSVIKNMLDALEHRGPDNKSILEVNKNLIFGHTRLNIIDLSDRANQPMQSNGCYLLFNGMIYNYLELKKLLKNYNFKTLSDTEVILAAYLSWGNNFLKKLDGMFSIVIWDNNKKKLIIARDRLGIKPLYYKIHNNTLYISSEIKPLLTISKNEINKQIVLKYFKYSMYEHGENIFFKNIKQFKPATIYVYEKDLKLKKETYWSLYSFIKKNNQEKKIENINEAFDLLKIQINRIKEVYSRTDTKISLLYSSGLDSNALLNLINDSEKKIGLLLSFGFKAKGIEDEIRLMKQTKFNHFKHKFKLNEFLNNLDNIQLQQEMPWGGPNVYFLSELLKYSRSKNYTVCLSADGADEIFGGYDKYYSDNRFKKKLDLNYVSLAIDKTKPHSTELFTNNFNKNLSEETSLDLPSNSFMDNARYLDITLSKLPRNFRFSDRYSMSQSVELRYPFLDHKLIELSFKFSDKLLITKNENKILLRKLFNDNKPKKHINSPQTNWFYEKKFIKYIDGLIQSSPMFDYGIDKAKCNFFVNNFYKNKQNNSFKLWQLVNYHLWIKNFFK
jgi:asparagine synthase (glutamine-hydrolysing)